MRISLALVVSAILLSSTVAAGDTSKSWATTALENFEMYCYRSGASFSRVHAMAAAFKLPQVPSEYTPLIAGQNSTDTEAYLIQLDRDRGMAIILATGKPDACSIYVQGLPFEQISSRFKTNYKLALAGRDDVGMQVSELYVPGGTTGGKNEARELGMIMVTHPKEASGDFFVIGYMPSTTVSQLFPK